MFVNKSKALSQTISTFLFKPTHYVSPDTYDHGLEPEDLIVDLQESHTLSELKVFRKLYELAQTTDKVFPSLDTIATMVGVSRSTVKRAISKFHTQGIIYKERRHYTSNRYYINYKYLVSSVRKVMNSWLTNFRHALFSLALISPMSCLADNEPVLKLSEKNFIKSVLLEGVTNSARGHGTERNSGFFQRELRDEAKERTELNSEALTLLQQSTLPLTLHGQMKLSVFSVEVIRRLLKLPFNFKADNVFAYLFCCAKNFSKQLGEPDPDFSLFDKFVQNQNLRYVPFIDPELYEQLKAEAAHAHKQKQMRNQPKGNPTSGQLADTLRAQEDAFNESSRIHRESQHAKIREMGLDPDQLSFNEIHRLLAGNATPEQITKEMESDNFRRRKKQLSSKRPTTPQEFQDTRNEVIGYMETKMANGEKLNEFELILLKGFTDQSPTAKANPFDKDKNAPTVLEILAQLRIPNSSKSNNKQII